MSFANGHCKDLISFPSAQRSQLCAKKGGEGQTHVFPAANQFSPSAHILQEPAGRASWDLISSVGRSRWSLMRRACTRHTVTSTVRTEWWKKVCNKTHMHAQRWKCHAAYAHTQAAMKTSCIAGGAFQRCTPRTRRPSSLHWLRLIGLSGSS